MRIKVVVALLSLAFFACGKKKLETPEAALAAIQEAYLEHDAKAFVAVLSKDTLHEFDDKVEMMRGNFQNTPENPQAAKAFEHMAKQMNIPVSKLKELTVEDYIGYMMQTDNASGSEVILLPKEMLPPAAVVKRVERGNKATLYFADEEKLSFIKTEAGWRVHLDAESVQQPITTPSEQDGED